MPDRRPNLELELINQIATVEQRIVELQSERTTLERLLMRVRHQNLTAKDVTRRNSVDRIIIENKILEALSNPSIQLRTMHLFALIKNFNPTLKPVTFRSHLHRLKEKGLIETGKQKGYWKKATVR